MKIIVAPMHMHARQYAKQHGINDDEFKTATEAHTLRNFPADTPIILVDSGVRFQDHAALQHVLNTKFTNVLRTTL